MTRAHVSGAGLPGVGQECFPLGAREHVRDLGLYGSAIVGVWTKTDDGAGSSSSTFDWGNAPVDARLDPIGSRGTASRGDTIREDTTHLVSFRDGQVISTTDRVRIEDSEWLVTALREVTDELIVRVEVKRA